MTDARIRITVYGVGSITTPSVQNDRMEEVLAAIESQPPQSRELFYHVMQMFIDKMPGMIAGRAPVNFEFYGAVWYRVLSHPHSGAETRAMIREILRHPERDIRITWWMRDLNSPDYVTIGEQFNDQIPNFDTGSLTIRDGKVPDSTHRTIH